MIFLGGANLSVPFFVGRVVAQSFFGICPIFENAKNFLGRMPVPEHILEKIIVKKKRAKICALKFKRILA